MNTMKRTDADDINDEESLNYDLCIICQEISSETVQKLTPQGYPAIFNAASSKFDQISNILKKELVDKEYFFSKNPVCHGRCRRFYSRRHYKSDENVTKKAKLDVRTRCETNLIAKNSCFICQKDRDTKGNRKLVLIATLSRQNEIWKKAKDLNDSKMLTIIEGFGDSCVDMIAKDFRYHYLCMTSYLNKKVKTKAPTHKSTDFYPFEDLQKVLFIDNKGVTISWIRRKIHEQALLVNITYASTYPRTSDIIAVLKSKFGEKIITLENTEGLSSVLFSTKAVMQQMKKDIIDENSNSESEETDSDSQPMHTSPHQTHTNIFHTATVIRRDIMNSKDCLLTREENILSISKEEAIQMIPPRLFNFIHFLLHRSEIQFDTDDRAIVVNETEKSEVLSLCQDILFLSGVKTPKSVGLALMLLKQRHKFLIGKLNQLGHCVSYSDAQRYLHDIAVKVDEEVGDSGIFIPSNIKHDQFTQFALDNLDFQEKSQDGKTTHGTTHIIYQHTDSGDSTNCTISLKHTNKRLTRRKLFLNETILSKTDREKSRSLKNLTLTFPSEYKNYEISSVWNLYSMVSDSADANDASPLSWSLFFETLLTDKENKTIIGYGPFVPESPTNPAVVQNSLDYFVSVATSLNQQHVIITADQAIYEIILALKSKYLVKYQSIIPRMGGFHIILNYLGAIGHLMSSSGIEELLVSGRILLEGTAKKIISGGKDYYQMIRCHTLIHSAIFDLYWEAFETWVRCEENSLEPNDVENFNTLIDEIIHLKAHLTSTENIDDCLIAFSNSALLITEIQTLKKQFEKSLEDNPTSKLWLMYLDMVAIAQWYIHAERSGSWSDHLSSVEKMLPYLVAAGHYKYVSYVPHYLKCMKELRLTAPSVWKEFESGKFTVHLKEGTFNGVWTDMALEQTFNKDCKTQLFSGISMQPETTERYLYALPILPSLSDQFLKLSEKSAIKPQHSHHYDGVTFMMKELQARERIKHIIRQKINPFTFETNDLLNIYSGHKCKSTELSNAKTIGLNALEKAEKDKSDKICPVKIQLFSDKVKTPTSIETKSKLYEDEAMVLRSLYFARDLNENQKVDVFSHEWLTYPPSLCQPDSCSFYGYTLRKGNKADFFNATKVQLKHTWVEVRELPLEADKKIVYVIDMMAFIQRHQSTNCKTFCELYNKYIDIIISNKPVTCDLIVLVGDRYESNTNCVKEMERRRRNKSAVATHEFEVHDNIEIPNWQQFLGNNSNKARLLKYITLKLNRENGRLPNNVSFITTGMAEESRTTTFSSLTNSKILTDLDFSNHTEADSRIFAMVQYVVSKLEYNKVVIEATDTDIFVLSLFFGSRINLDELWMHRFDVFIPVHHIIKKLSAESNKESEINLCDMLLSTYVLTGCDTVSFVFRKGKTNAFKTCIKYKNDNQLKPLLNYPLQGDFSEITEFKNAARYFFKILYGRPFFKGNLDKLRAHLFLSCKSDIRNLPPTEDSFHQHILRTAYQLIIWKTATLVNPLLPSPRNFGWTSKDNVLVPQLITINARPNVSIENVFCKCKDIKNCSGNCGCRKAGLECIISCYCEGHCQRFTQQLL